jgi:flagellar motor switch protein FliG
MDRERQTLELLQLLGDEVADAVLGRLQPDRAEKLRAGLKTDTPHLSTISRQREVLDEFECFFQFAMKNRPPASNESDEQSSTDALNDAAAESDSSEGSGGDSEDSSEAGAYDQAAVRRAANGSGNDDSLLDNEAADASKAGDESDNGDSSTDPESADADSDRENADEENSMDTLQNGALARPLPTGDPLQDLQTLSIHQIALALASEQSRTTAILLSHLPAKLTGDVLNLLKPEYQKLVMKELTKEQHAPAVLVERIARATFTRAQQLPPDPPDTRDHADRVAEVLRSVPKAGRKNMLAAIEEQDPELAKSLLTRIYRFDDISTLNKAVVQRVLGEVDSTNLTTALFGASEEIKEAIYANLSKRARQTIEEEMQFMTNVAESRIQQARDSIAEVIAKIDMESES